MKSPVTPRRERWLDGFEGDTNGNRRGRRRTVLACLSHLARSAVGPTLALPSKGTMLEALLMPLEVLLSGIAMIGALVVVKLSRARGGPQGGAYAVIPILLAPVVVRELFRRIAYRGSPA
jgi:hypothetical protein